LIRFGEALKSIPNQTLTEIDPNIAWAGPKGFRDIASHWYEEGLDLARARERLASNARCFAAVD
jgi:uncharacterized protein with HEPN domain